MKKADKNALFRGLPYSEKQLKEMPMTQLWALAAFLGAPLREDGKYGSKKEVIALVIEAQESHEERIDNFCEMCGKYVFIRQNAHIVAEAGRERMNILRLCPTCHLMFDTYLKPRLYKALLNVGVKNLPGSWEKSIYHQAFEAAIASKKKRKNKQ